jgi:hypothetical protein
MDLYSMNDVTLQFDKVQPRPSHLPPSLSPQSLFPSLSKPPQSCSLIFLLF